MNDSSVYNTTLNATSPAVPFDYLFNTLTILDNVVKAIGLSVILFYILVLVFSKSLHKRTFMFLNHAAISGIFYETMIVSYAFGPHPVFADENLNNILCSISELVWIFGSFMRAYSMLLLAIYRYLATFHVNVFKKINQSILYLVGLLALVYAIAILLPLIGKYAFKTSASYTYCLDGSSPYLLNTILYLVFAYVFLIIIPVPAVVVNYVKIMRKLNTLSRSVGQEKKLDVAAESASQSVAGPSQANPNPASTPDTQSTGTSLASKSKRPAVVKDPRKLRRSYEKQKTFAYQMIFMCISLTMSSVVLVIFQLRGLPNYFTTFYYVRPVFRMYLISAMTIVPLTCLYYHPAKQVLFRTAKSNLSKTK